MAIGLAALKRFFNGQNRNLAPGPCPLVRFFAQSRRDGARLLSSAVVITSIGLLRLDHPAGQLVALVGGLVSLYWWHCYRQLKA